MYDICESPVSLNAPNDLDHWNGVVLGFLSHGQQTPVHLGALLSANPKFCMGHAARGLFSMMMGRRELVAVAQEAYDTAQQIARNSPLTAREAGWLKALGAWLAGSPLGAIAAMEEILAHSPQDTLSAKVSQAIRFILGDKAGMRRSIEAVLGAHGQDHACRGYALGCHAFTLEETGDYTGAERTGRRGLTYAPDDAWGLHAVAHVYDMKAQSKAGIELIEAHAEAWTHCNNFRYHVWWHKALLHMDRGEFDIALALYDHEIRAEKSDDYRDIANATSLLMRLELEGVAIGKRWEELAALSDARTQDGCLVFADLHYMLALCGADKGPARQAMLSRFAQDAAARPKTESSSRIIDPGLAAMEGLNAFAEGRYDAAFLNLAAARPAMQSIGGSHAQRDVFERMTIDAGIRAGRIDQVEVILDARCALRGGATDHFAATRYASLSDARRIPAQ